MAHRLGAIVALIVLLRISLAFAIERALPWAALEYGGVALEVGNVYLALAVGRFTIEDLR